MHNRKLNLLLWHLSHMAFYCKIHGRTRFTCTGKLPQCEQSALLICLLGCSSYTRSSCFQFYIHVGAGPQICTMLLDLYAHTTNVSAAAASEDATYQQISMEVTAWKGMHGKIHSRVGKHGPYPGVSIDMPRVIDVHAKKKKKKDMLHELSLLNFYRTCSTQEIWLFRNVIVTKKTLSSTFKWYVCKTIVLHCIMHFIFIHFIFIDIRLIQII